MPSRLLRPALGRRAAGRQGSRAARGQGSRAGRGQGSRAAGAVLAAALAAGLATGLTACSSDPVAAQYRNGDNKGYIGSDGLRVDEIKAADRTQPVTFGGTLETGKTFSSSETAGQVVVVNFWYAACGPCRVEAKDLETVAQKYQGKGVSFIGVNTYDQPDTANSFNEKYGVTYPSIIDVNTGAAKLAFAEVTSIQATPTTLVLDRQGRVAARIIGPIGSASILDSLVQTALAEKS